MKFAFEGSASPEMSPSASNVLVTAVVYQPFVPSAGAVGPASVISGADRSILIPETVAASAGLPARSMQVPVLVTCSAEPSPVRVAPVTSSWSTPDPPASAHVKVTVTSELFQPARLGAGDACPVTTGAVSSIEMPPTVSAAAALPALSMHSPALVTDWPAPSSVRVSPWTKSVAMPEPPWLS